MHEISYTKVIEMPQALLGEVLVSIQAIMPDQLLIALQEQQHTGRLLGEELLHLHFITPSVLLSVLALRLNLPILTAPLLPLDTMLEIVSVEACRQYTIFPIALEEEALILSVAIHSLQALALLDPLRQCYQLRLYLSTQQVIEEALAQYMPRDDLVTLLNEIAGQTLLQAPYPEEMSIVIRLVEALFNEAIRLNASDLHCELETAWINLRYRIDGVLTPPMRLHRQHWSALSVRIKIIAGVDIAETRANQDGRLYFFYARRQIDCRVSIVPTLLGENIVIRFLDRAMHHLNFQHLGFSLKQRQDIQQILKRPYGITLVVGPTGSGKTTTLYTLLQQFDATTHNLMTLEDPVEYCIPGVRQIPLQSQIKLNYAEAVRAILRQAPDIILIGEIRDSATAIAAFQAGMTGHRVLASVHANSAMGAITRLMELGVPAQHIAVNVVGIIGQRLVRRICKACQCKGCIGCANTGFKGRVVIAEVIYMNRRLAAMIETGATETALRVYQQQSGVSRLFDDAWQKVKLGITHQSELIRVLDQEREWADVV